MHEAPAPIGLAGWLRIAGRGTLALALLVGSVLFYYAARPFTRHNPAPRLFLGTLLRVVGGRLRVEGERAGERTLLLANHVSWMDILALAGATGSAFVAHAGLAGIAPLHWLCSLNRTVFVARQERGSVAGQVAQVREALDDSRVLTLFPEGTTGDGASLLPFKSALLAAFAPCADEVTVQPVQIDYGAEAETIAWVGDEPGLANVLRIMARARPVEVTVRLLPPLTADERRDRKAMAAAARTAIETATA